MSRKEFGDAGVRDISDAVAQAITQKSTVVLNVNQQTIVVTEDRLRLKLMEFLGRVRNRDAWIAPLSLALALILTIATATFHDWLLKAPVWEAIFEIVFVASVIWAIHAIVNSFRVPTLDDLISSIKSESSHQLDTSSSTNSAGKSDEKISTVEVNVVNENLQCWACGQPLNDKSVSHCPSCNAKQ